MVHDVTSSSVPVVSLLINPAVFFLILSVVLTLINLCDCLMRYVVVENTADTLKGYTHFLLSLPAFARFCFPSQPASFLPSHGFYVRQDDLVVSASLDQTVRVWDTTGLRKKTVRGAPSAMVSYYVGSIEMNEME